jgi:hypothetical protein
VSLQLALMWWRYDRLTHACGCGCSGWQLGEMNEWRKMTVSGATLSCRLACIFSPVLCRTHQIDRLFSLEFHTALILFLLQNFELGVRVPLVIRTPWLPKSIGKFTPALAEAVDLFPTFVDLSKLGTAAKLPSDQILQGFSLQPILVDPPPTGTGIRPYALSQFAKSLTFSSELGKMVPWDECDKCDKTTNVTDPEASDKRYAHAIDYMGYSLREDRWRFTECALHCPPSSDWTARPAIERAD